MNTITGSLPQAQPALSEKLQRKEQLASPAGRCWTPLPTQQALQAFRASGAQAWGADQAHKSSAVLAIPCDSI